MKHFIKIIIIQAVFIFFQSGGICAEDVLSWKDCVELAKKSHPDLVSATEKLKQSKADRWIAISGLLPQITTDADIGKSESPPATRTGSSTIRSSYSYGITGEQLLFDGFKTSNTVAAASKDVDAAQYFYNTVSSDVLLRLRVAFIELLKAQELLLITQSIARRRKQNWELIKLRHEAGREHKGAFLTAEADLAQAEFEVSRAGRNITLSRRQLTKELGAAEFIPMEVKGVFKVSVPDADRPDFMKLADATPSVKKLIAERESALHGLRSARAEFLPEVSISGTMGRSAFQRRGSDWSPKRDDWSAGIEVSFPLFEGASRIAEVKKASHVLNQERADERSGRDAVILALEDAWTELQDAIEEMAVQKKFLTATTERAKIAQAQYSTGLISFDNWIIIEDDLVAASKSFLDAQANVMTKEAYWIQAKGGTLEDVKI